MAVVLAWSSERRQTCTACGRAIAAHYVLGHWVGCTRDVVIMQDQATIARRLRLKLIQARVSRVKLQPFGVER